MEEDLEREVSAELKKVGFLLTKGCLNDPGDPVGW
jgi:hypothetical protein